MEGGGIRKQHTVYTLVVLRFVNLVFQATCTSTTTYTEMRGMHHPQRNKTWVSRDLHALAVRAITIRPPCVDKGTEHCSHSSDCRWSIAPCFLPKVSHKGQAYPLYGSPSPFRPLNVACFDRCVGGGGVEIC